MQQVKSEAFFVGARPVELRALPVPVRRSPLQRATNRFNRAAVLHGKIIRRCVIGAALLVGATALIQVREPIGGGISALAMLAQGGFAEAGLSVGEISITGQTLTSEQEIFDALGIQPDMSTLAFDVEAARNRIAELPAVDSVTVRKTYPAEVLVSVTEKIPVARWRVDGITFVIDATGAQIGEDRGAYGELPLVIGDGASDDALVMIRALSHVPQLEDGLVALSRIADRRWDMIYDTGLRIQLPEQGVAQALVKLADYQSQYQLLDRDLTVIDLRVDSIVAVRPTKREPPEES